MAREEHLREALKPLRGTAMGAMLWGSHASGTSHARSDVDVCLVVGREHDAEEAFAAALNVAGRHRDLDLKLFEDLPLYLQGAVIDADRVLFAEDEVALYEYLRPFRRRWDDEKHRARVSAEDVLRALARG